MNNKDVIEDYVKQFSKEFDKKLINLIPKNNFFSKRLYEALVYVISVGGKRLRPLLLTEISKLPDSSCDRTNTLLFFSS